MATIGTFTKNDSGFAGTIQTLGLKATKVAITGIEKAADTAPDFRVKAGNAEIGAAWHRTSKGGNDYISVKLDDPSFAAPIYANLVEQQDKGYALIWSR
ncbi:DUF736 domain-containing protein [Thalassospira marina]|uniref:DUF736 domain-containing protein n=1 Tax=Thalassospira marina TaxID=2048283 RepID=A0A2N3KD00_9PROT|nr:DUF736 domain-containing protein [Thalassospira marina]PKR48448.1 hypothetical protein COO20_24630 [Thalassospira marina]